MIEDKKMRLVMQKLLNTHSKYALFKRDGVEEKVKRPFINGKPLILANEIYARKSNHITEYDTFDCLNKLIAQGKADLVTKNGWIWHYSKA